MIRPHACSRPRKYVRNTLSEQRMGPDSVAYRRPSCGAPWSFGGRLARAPWWKDTSPLFDILSCIRPARGPPDQPLGCRTGFWRRTAPPTYRSRCARMSANTSVISGGSAGLSARAEPIRTGPCAGSADPGHENRTQPGRAARPESPRREQTLYRVTRTHIRSCTARGGRSVARRARRPL